jgi:hypothetical protein
VSQLAKAILEIVLQKTACKKGLLHSIRFLEEGVPELF